VNAEEEEEIEEEDTDDDYNDEKLHSRYYCQLTLSVSSLTTV
jgi:hypothetical protein